METKAESLPRVKIIHQAILEEERRLRAQHPWLARQDALGAALFAGSLLGMGGVAALSLGGVLPAVVAVGGMALLISVLHELEHDLIHDLYFRDRPWVQDLLFLGIFLSKMSLDPWSRRRIHLHHHRVSGQPIDIEERLIGLGMPLGPKRLLLTVFPVLSVLLWPALRPALRDLPPSSPSSARPGVGRRLLRWGARLLSAGFAVLPLVVLPAAALGVGWAEVALVLYVAPNLLRHAAIAFISSSSHYYGDIPDNAVYYQNQILDHWLTWPLQLFCFNFGATHILHHYVVRQPFYLRQWIAPRVRDVLIAQGVRHNDLGSVRRANRWALP